MQVRSPRKEISVRARATGAAVGCVRGRAGSGMGSGFRKNPTKISEATSGMRRGFELRDSGSACGI